MSQLESFYLYTYTADFTRNSGGLAAAVSLRRAGHAVSIYERYDYAGEVGASISCANNGTKWLFEWGVDVEKARPVTLRNLIMHDVREVSYSARADLANARTPSGRPVRC